VRLHGCCGGLNAVAALKLFDYHNGQMRIGRKIPDLLRYPVGHIPYALATFRAFDA